MFTYTWMLESSVYNYYHSQKYTIIRNQNSPLIKDNSRHSLGVKNIFKPDVYIYIYI